MSPVPTSSTDRLVGGRYRLRRQLGRGGSGIVWVAEDELLGRQVAVKEFLLPEIGAEDRETMLARVLREARAAARLHDASLVTVFDVVREDEQPWIVMEYVHGRSLAQLVREDGPMRPQRAAEVGLAVLHALRTAHAGGVLHRDVKPANVLIDEDGRILLTDFGIASTTGDPSITTTGVLLGSPAYMPPERARGERAAPSSDLWSLGATLYTLVEGEPPYSGESSIAVLTAVADDRRRPAERAGALAPVLADLLDPDPAKRPDAAALEVRLQRAAAEPDDETTMAITRPAEARPERVGEKTATVKPASTDSPRRGAGAGAAALGGAAVVGAAAAGAAAATDAPPAAPAQPAAPPREAAAPADPPRSPAPAAPRRVEPRRVPPRPATAPRDADRHRRRRAGALLGGGVGAAVLLVGGVAYLSQQGSASHPTAAPSAASTPTPASPPASAKASTSPRASASSTPSATPSASASASAGVVPAGWQVYRNPAYGWTIAHPAGWTTNPGLSSTQIDLRDPQSSRLMRVDIAPQAHASAIADWRSYEPVFAQQVQGYQRIKIAPSDGGNGTRSADWEFTFRSGSVTLHVLDRGVVDGRTAHALYWQTTDGDWAASQTQLQQFTSSFVPPNQ